MWQRFSESARKSVFYAQEEALVFNEHIVTPEHLFLGLMHGEENLAKHIMIDAGMEINDIKKALVDTFRVKEPRQTFDLQLSDSSKSAIDYAYSEARELNNAYIGTEHLLIGVLHQANSSVCKICEANGLSLDKAREIAKRLQSGE